MINAHSWFRNQSNRWELGKDKQRKKEGCLFLHVFFQDLRSPAAVNRVCAPQGRSCEAEKLLNSYHGSRKEELCVGAFRQRSKSLRWKTASSIYFDGLLQGGRERGKSFKVDHSQENSETLYSINYILEKFPYC
ncbi:hypothetical protein CEXT_675841 [Caerostris extrusa]|uniref:Uncharacterized protein n=1 Tax=Caerostris extrusa TaxID=172846 RepID=A0AAV4XAF4_CAEEX|nr:hypothetical protein CEXT_675841 [Caerostris extrusa]